MLGFMSVLLRSPACPCPSVHLLVLRSWQSHRAQRGCLQGLSCPLPAPLAQGKLALQPSLAQGKLSEAEGLYARASLAADQRQAEGSSTGVRALDWQQHVAADVLLGAAQAAAAQQAWDKSEQLLNKVLHLLLLLFMPSLQACSHACSHACVSAGTAVRIFSSHQQSDAQQTA